MALSRIWAAFILISIAVAGVKYAFFPENKEIFSSMVTGRAGDTHRIATPVVNPPAAPAPASYTLQRADGIIETCKTAVNLSIGLIGLMALFMGLMSIAEAAGGIRVLSRIIGPFFSRLFPDLPKGHPAMGHMMMNF